eukprot:GHVU01166399.1.p1 GENE.GHVU01166399.1~~GHVU01166399.1.p1  ORF type:complete len:154 (-),score=9.33 GHVU01166399.1:423-884(-)
MYEPIELDQYLDETRGDDWMKMGLKYAKIDQNIRSKFPLHWILSLALPTDDDDSEPSKEQILAIRLSLLVYHTTKGREIPKIFQLEAALASIQQNSLIVAGTGSGKTHIMALLMLLEHSDSTRVFVTISPLKRLQATQVRDLILEHWKILTTY